MPSPELTRDDRRRVLGAVLRSVERKFMGLDVDIAALRRTHEAQVLDGTTAEEFEAAVNAMLRSLGTSHVGFFRGDRPRVAGRVAIAATFMRVATPDGERWMFQDVHPGGPAAEAGIAPGDVLLTIDGKDVVPPEGLPFGLGSAYTFTVRRRDGTTVQPTIDVPVSKDRKRPIVVPGQVVTARRLDEGIGVVRVSMFPGVLGMDVARDISRAVAELTADRLIIDLRGNTGGGIGCLRPMSLLCADSRGVGYSVGRSIARRGFNKNDLPRFDRIPSSQLGVLPLIFRFALAKRSIAVFTEGLGPQPHHGHTAILVNEHSASAAEMVAAFASETGLATVVGTRTPGRLVAASSFKVGHGYRVALPVAAYYTWNGTNLEGRGVEPDIPAPLAPEALWFGEDNQLETACGAITP
ncbi:MAG: S41 family peptidase [Vicinamibacterales bacterium]